MNSATRNKNLYFLATRIAWLADTDDKMAKDNFYSRFLYQTVSSVPELIPVH